MIFSSQTKKVLITVIVADLVVIAVFLALFFTIKSKNQHISLLRNNIELETKKSADFQSLKKFSEGTAEARSKIDSIFVGKDGMVDFLGYLESIIKSAGAQAEISSINLEEARDVKNDSYEIIKIRGEAIGSWSSVYRALTLLDSLPFAVSINAAEIHKFSAGDVKSTKTKGGWSGNFELNVLKLK